MSTLTHTLRSLTWKHALVLGWSGSTILALTSYTVGAIRARGGILHVLNLTSLTFGHFTGIFVVVMWIGIGLMLLSWITAGGHILRHNKPLTRPMIACWITPLVFAGPLMSRDVYSYLMQGTLTRDRINAYEHGAAANPGPLLFEVSADWRNTTTPYGPLHLWIGDLITTITGSNITIGTLAYKALSICSFLVMIWAVARLSVYHGVRPSVAIWLGVANPLVIIHLIGGMHNENLMMALVLSGLLASRMLPALPGFLAGTVLIATGTALKVTALVALPFLVWIFVARYAGSGTGHLWKDSPRRLLTLIMSGLTALGITGGVIQLITTASGQTWGWVEEMAGNTKVINPLALPSFLASSLSPLLMRFVNDDLTFNVVLSTIRPYSTALMGISLVCIWWVFRHNETSALQGASAAYLVICVLNSVALPWYYATVIPLAAVWMSNRQGVFLTVWLSMSLSMMFDGGGNNRLYDLWWVLAISALMWFLCRGALGYTPLREEHRTDPWVMKLPTRP